MHFNEQAQESGLDLANLIRIVRERWKLILAAVLAGAALAILYTLLTKPLYRAGAVLEVNPPRVEVLEDEERSTGAQQVGTWDFIATQVGLLKSQSLGERVAQDLNLAANAAFVDQSGDPESRLKAAGAKVAGGIGVEMPKEGQLINYTFTADDPQIAAMVANGIADAFIDSNLQRRYDASNYAREFLQRQLNKTRGELEKSERALVSYAQSQGIINTASGEDTNSNSDANSLQGASLVALNSALAEATARRIAAQGAYQQARLAGGSAEATQSTSALRGTLAALEAEYQEKRTLLKPEHPDMVALKSRIDELNRQISAEQSRVAGGQATTLLAAYRAAVASENALRSRVNQLRGSVLDLRGRSIQYNILQRDVDTNRSLYDALLQRYKEVGVAGGIGDSPVSIVDRAQVPGGPFKPNPLLNLLAGIGLGLLAGIALAVLLDLLHDVLKTREDVRTRLGLSCLGVIPKRKGDGSIVSDLADEASGIAEAYSAVLAALRFSTDHGTPRTLLLTSTTPAEGKSSSAFAIAQNLARRGEKVLLIDADLRRPIFKTQSSGRGLTKLLTNEESIRGHLHETQFENLWLLPCGPTPPNPADLLSSPRFAKILVEAGREFDRIIIDGPPMLGLADAVLLASAAEHVALVVESGRTRTKAAKEVIHRLSSAGANILGVVLTKSTEEASSYGYSYRYSSIGDNRDDLILITQQSNS
ncbi:polysaccharide biosynthesis tyrosine autokinase [Sphingomonas sp. HDW15A]|uniref:GumC family protein n=1 Tax=Sphingomonas sp. HDW15A TaxID=2714942 RepID=UPI00140CF308|nr:polysaccharide biosynthesis tyrosine autokinase [Sphingomonas sp. HDW15A]QIK95842.1 polysaccharide biosynthesis tyrosine autokinase [Sphingomonas sp. HDW15A]